MGNSAGFRRLLAALSITGLFDHVTAQALPVGTSSVGGRAEYMGTAVATAPLGMPTLAWNCAKMPAICGNVNSQNPLTGSQGNGFGSLVSGPIELHYDINADERNNQRGRTACPSGWAGRNCRPGVNFQGTNVVCADGETFGIQGACFAGELWQRNDGTTQCLNTPFIAYPGGTDPVALIWSCDEWPPKSTVEGGAGANRVCAPQGASVIAENILPAQVVAVENKQYSRSEQNYQAGGQNMLRQYVSGQNPPLLGIWAFEFNTFFDTSSSSYATRVTYPVGGGQYQDGGVTSRSENAHHYRSEFQMTNGSVLLLDHKHNSFDHRGQLAKEESPLDAINLRRSDGIFARQNITVNGTTTSLGTATTLSSTSSLTTSSFSVISSSDTYTPVTSPVNTGALPGPTYTSNSSTVSLGTGSLSTISSTTAPLGVSSIGGTGSPGSSLNSSSGETSTGGLLPPGTGSLPSTGTTLGGTGATTLTTLTTTSGNETSTITRATTGGSLSTITSTASNNTHTRTFSASDSSAISAAESTTITPSAVSTSLVPDPTITANTTITTTGPDGSPTVVPELVGCDACGAAALLIFGLGPAIAPAVYVIPGVGLVPIGPGDVPLDGTDASAVTAGTTASISTTTGSISTTSASSNTSTAAEPTNTSEEAEACNLVVFNDFGGDAEPEDDSYATTTSSISSSTSLSSSTSSTSSPPITTTTPTPTTSNTPPPATTQTICAASNPEVDCIKDSDCPCPTDIPHCTLVPKCQQIGAAQFQCACLPPGVG